MDAVRDAHALHAHPHAVNECCWDCESTLAAERRNITPSHVCGDTWIVSAGMTQEEEMDTEESFYYDTRNITKCHSKGEYTDTAEAPALR